MVDSQLPLRPTEVNGGTPWGFAVRLQVEPSDIAELCSGHS